MPILGAEHDLAHPVEGDETWSESYYFNAYDPQSDSGFFTRIGIRPNEGTMDVGLSVWLPGRSGGESASEGGLAEYRFVRETTEMVDRRLDVGNVTYEMLEPMQRWRLMADCEAHVRGVEPVPIGLDVTFDALIPAVGVDGQAAAARAEGAAAKTAQSVGKGHLEQSGRWTGTLAVGGEALDWTEARGNRDKSWGPRRWGGPQMWRWFSINIGAPSPEEETHFGGIRIGTDAGDLHRGWVWLDGEHTSIREWRVKTELEADGLTHAVTHLTAVDKREREHQLRGDLMRVAPIGYGRTGTVVNEGLARWDYDGRTGYGIAEYLHQLDDDGLPVIPIE